MVESPLMISAIEANLISAVRMIAMKGDGKPVVVSILC